METLWRCKSEHWTYWIFPGRLSEAEEWFRIDNYEKMLETYNIILKQTCFISGTYNHESFIQYSKSRKSHEQSQNRKHTCMK